ncbi:MAG: antibiotic biosynthesis monooxygenase [Thermomicrobiales bacterium]
MKVTKALYAMLEARPGKEQDVADFLRDALPAVEAEPDTVGWFAIQISPSTFGIFDAFPDDAGRQAHLSGAVVSALTERADELFATPPNIQMVDVLATKLP